MARPKRDLERLSVFIPRRLLTRLKKLAEAEDKTLSEVVREVLRNKLPLDD